MNDIRPPALATWLLNHAARGNDALVGDLLEEHRRGRSDGWYWGQVLTVVAVTFSKGALLVLGTVALFVVGSRFSVPGARADTLTLLAGQAPGTPFGFLNILAGGQLSGVTVFALGIMPYVTAAIIVQAGALIWRFMHRHDRTRRGVPVVAATWCVAVVLCAFQAFGLAVFLERTSAINGGLSLVSHPGGMFRMTTLVTLTVGTTCLMFISDQISRRRLGNGMLLVFVAGVIAGLSGAMRPLLTGQIDPWAVLSYAVLHVAIVAVVSHAYRREIVAVEAA